MKKLFLSLIIASGISACSIEADQPLETTQLRAGSATSGLVYGKAEVGPLCPVEPCELSDEEKAAHYKVRTMIIYSPDSSYVSETSLDGQGNFYFNVEPGEYILDMKPFGSDYSKDLPMKLQVETGDEQEVNVSIRTGVL